MGDAAETTERYPSVPIRAETVSYRPFAGDDMRRWATETLLVGMENNAAIPEDRLAVSQIHMRHTYDPAPTVLGVCAQE